MSKIKDRAKMFSNDDKDLEKNLVSNSNPKKSSKPESYQSSNSNFWTKKKIYIAIGIASSILLITIIIIVVVVLLKSSGNSNNNNNDSNRNSDSNNNSNSDSNTKSDSNIDNNSDINSDSNSDSSSDTIINDLCDRPYNIEVYSDKALSSKLKECGYKEGTELFEYCMSAIKRHNLYRACHNAQPLMFNCEILKISQDYSQYLLDNNKFEHSGNTYHGAWMGENLAYTGGYSVTGETPTDMWYDEIKDYKFDKPSFQSGCGHFTQVVWKNSAEFGIGLACANRACYMTANYYPGGNYGYDQDYARNVQNLQ